MITVKPYDELLSLTDEQIEQWIDLECARAGVPFLPELPTAPQVEQPKADQTLFEIGDLLFRDRVDAERVAEILRDLTVYETHYLPGTYSHNGFRVDEDAAEIKTKHLFSAEHWERSRKAHADHEALKNAYEKAKSEYDKIYRERRGIEREVRDAIEAAWQREHRRKDLDRHYSRYLAIANGDETVARKFLKEAYPVLVEEFAEERPDETAAEDAVAVGAGQDEDEIPF